MLCLPYCLYKSSAVQDYLCVSYLCAQYRPTFLFLDRQLNRCASKSEPEKHDTTRALIDISSSSAVIEVKGEG